MDNNDALKLENLNLKLALLQAQFQLVQKERDELAAKMAAGSTIKPPGDSAINEAFNQLKETQ